MDQDLQLENNLNPKIQVNLSDKQSNPTSFYYKISSQNRSGLTTIPYLQAVQQSQNTYIAQNVLQKEAVIFRQKTSKQKVQNNIQSISCKVFPRQNEKKRSKIDQKKQEKAQLNKVFSPIVLHNQNEVSMQLQQKRILIKMSFEKKQANYQMLKEWDRKRAEQMAFHGKIVEILQVQVENRIKISLVNFQYYQSFFRQKAKQQQKYINSQITEARYALQNNFLSKNVYKNCSVILNSLYDENTKRCKKISDFIQLIKQKILKELTEIFLENSQRSLLKFRQKINTLKSAHEKQNIQTEQKAKDLSSLFIEQSINITNKTNKDFYLTQLSFLRKTLRQIEIQRKLGEYCLQYYHAALKEELKRSQVIHQAMSIYSKGLQLAYNTKIQKTSSEIEQASKKQEIKLIKDFYALQQMFDKSARQLFKLKNKLTSKDSINIESLTKFINHFDYKPYDSRIILLKQFQVKHILKNKQSKQETCYLVITVDSFLHIFLKQNKDSFGKPEITIKIRTKFIELKSGNDENLEIVSYEEKFGSMMSYFWKNQVKQVFYVRFAKKNQKEEFIDFISKLMVGQR